MAPFLLKSGTSSSNFIRLLFFGLWIFPASFFST